MAFVGNGVGNCTVSCILIKHVTLGTGEHSKYPPITPERVVRNRAFVCEYDAVFKLQAAGMHDIVYDSTYDPFSTSGTPLPTLA